MSQPVKVSDELIRDARLTAEIAERSECRSDRVLGTARPSDRTVARGLPSTRPPAGRAAVPLSECLASVGVAATRRRRVVEYLELRPFPHYQPVPGSPGWWSALLAMAQRTVGRFVGREFQPVPCPWKEFAEFDRRPIVVAIAGPNGAGKTTFFHAHLASAGLRFVNADVLAAELAIRPYEAARLGDALRQALVEPAESFVFVTVFSDPGGRQGRVSGRGCSVRLRRRLVLTSASPAPISRSSAWRCAFHKAVTMFPTISCGQGSLERSSISRPLSRSYPMS